MHDFGGQTNFIQFLVEDYTKKRQCINGQWQWCIESPPTNRCPLYLQWPCTAPRSLSWSGSTTWVASSTRQQQRTSEVSSIIIIIYIHHHYHHPQVGCRGWSSTGRGSWTRRTSSRSTTKVMNVINPQYKLLAEKVSISIRAKFTELTFDPPGPTWNRLQSSQLQTSVAKHSF